MITHGPRAALCGRWLRNYAPNRHAGERVAIAARRRRSEESCFAGAVFRIGNSARGTGKTTHPASSLRDRGGKFPFMRDDYIKAALLVIEDPTVLINVVSRRVKQLKRGNRALVESLEKLSAEDIALREIIEGKIIFELATPADIANARR
jgi:DNA-directed RNA polymerase subunit omega